MRLIVRKDVTMRIVVFSDTHGIYHRLLTVFERTYRQTDCYLHLGDGIDEFKRLEQKFACKSFYSVRGNCDFGKLAPLERSITLDGVCIYMTHGHTLSVKAGLDRLKHTAVKQHASIALYGHTHKSFTAYCNGLYILNPGSLGQPRDRQPTYGTIDLTKAGIVTNIVEVEHFERT